MSRAARIFRFAVTVSPILLFNACVSFTPQETRHENPIRFTRLKFKPGIDPFLSSRIILLRGRHRTDRKASAQLHPAGVWLGNDLFLDANGNVSLNYVDLLNLRGRREFEIVMAPHGWFSSPVRMVRTPTQLTAHSFLRTTITRFQGDQVIWRGLRLSTSKNGDEVSCTGGGASFSIVRDLDGLRFTGTRRKRSLYMHYNSRALIFWNNGSPTTIVSRPAHVAVGVAGTQLLIKRSAERVTFLNQDGRGWVIDIGKKKLTFNRTGLFGPMKMNVRSLR